VQLFVGKVYRLFLGERLDAFLATTTLEVLKKDAQAIRPSRCQDEVAADDLIQQLAFRAALLVGPGPQLFEEPGIDKRSLLLGQLYAS